jgi:zinc-ribbon domain
MGSSAGAPSRSVAYCAQCGTKLDVGDRFCPECGAPVAAAAQAPQSPLPASGRTESIVLSVPPSFENECIKERELFGWNLQNRQEVIGHLRLAETPDNLGHAIWQGAVEGATGKKTLEYDHYVKLHFARSVALPNLSRIKQLESEYFSLPFPGAKGILWPVIFTLMPVPGALVALSDPLGKHGGPGLPVLVGAIVWIILGLRWVRGRRQKRAAAASTCAASRERAEAIKQEVARLL